MPRRDVQLIYKLEGVQSAHKYSHIQTAKCNTPVTALLSTLLAPAL